jgi:outer membrane usher protein
VGYYYTQSSDREKADRSWSFNLNIPLGGGLAESSVSYSTTSDNNGRSSQQVSLYGAVPGRHLDYSLQQGHANAGQGSNSSAALDYHGGYGSAQLGYRHDSASNQLTWGASARWWRTRMASRSGNPLATVSPSSAPGAADVAIRTGQRAYRRRGYAVVPTLTVYRKNTITLDTESMSNDTDVDLQGQTVIPGGGAVVLANYQTHIGNRVLFTLRDRDGAIPFGASVHLPGGRRSRYGSGRHGGRWRSGVPQRDTARGDARRDLGR